MQLYQYAIIRLTLFGKIKSLKIILIFLITVLLGCEKEEEIFEPDPQDIHYPDPQDIQYDFSLKLAGASCAYDSISGTFYYPVDSDTISDYYPLVNYSDNVNDIHFNGKKLIKQSYNSLGKICTNKSYKLIVQYKVDTNILYNLIFITLPTVQIFTETEIVDEPKTIGKLILNNPYYQNDHEYSREIRSLIGIEIRGNIYLGRPKSSYGIELWTDEFGTENKDISLLGLREDDDWILDAMYGDLMRMKNRIAFQIWNSMTELCYLEKEPDAFCGIHGEFVEVFVNNEYQGVYSLNEKLDRKQLKLKKFTNTTRGLLYKGEEWGNKVTSFYHYMDTTSDITWDGWELQYPKPDQQILWAPLYDLTKFVVESDDNDFKNNIGQYIDMNNAIDYYLFINYIMAMDNMGKNTFLARYDINDVFFIVPWDMDCSFGRYLDATDIGYKHILTNNLFGRLLEVNPDDYKLRLKERWKLLIKNELAFDNVISQFEVYSKKFAGSGVIERENRKWKDAGLNSEDELIYIRKWLHNRINFLNRYYDDL